MKTYPIEIKTGTFQLQKINKIDYLILDNIPLIDISFSLKPTTVLENGIHMNVNLLDKNNDNATVSVFIERNTGSIDIKLNEYIEDSNIHDKLSDFKVDRLYLSTNENISMTFEIDGM